MKRMEGGGFLLTSWHHLLILISLTKQTAPFSLGLVFVRLRAHLNGRC